ncbi:hypothetical protein EPUL_005289, partial [Erysiphe pulchra]
MASIIRHRKRPPQEEPPPAESVGPNPSYSQLQQEVVNLASSSYPHPTASTTTAAATCTQNTFNKSQDPFLTTTPPTPRLGTLTAALDRGAATIEAARISREKTVLSVAKALDNILPDFKKNCPESAELFEKVLLTAIEDLDAACGTGSNKNKKPKQGEHKEGHPMRSHKPFTLMKKINEVLGDPTCVKDAYATSSGVALVAGNDTKVHKILQAKDQLKVVFSATEIERQESWINFLAQPVPKRLHSIFGNGFQIDENALAEETERITGCRPVRAHWTAKSKDQTKHEGTIVLYFRSSIKPNWPRAIRFFGAPTTVQKLYIKKPLTQCEKCFGFYHSRNCSRIARCAQCSRPRHTGNCSSTCTSHICPPRCINCRGPHKADYTECPARPIRIHGVFTKLNSRQIRAVRIAGGAAWTQVHAAIQNGSDIASPAENLTQAKESRTDDMEALNDEEEADFIAIQE